MSHVALAQRKSDGQHFRLSISWLKLTTLYCCHRGTDTEPLRLLLFVCFAGDVRPFIRNIFKTHELVDKARNGDRDVGSPALTPAASSNVVAADKKREAAAPAAAAAPAGGKSKGEDDALTHAVAAE